MKSHSKMYLSRPIWIFAFIALQLFIKDVTCQDWLKVYPAFFDGFSGYATQGPETGWGNQYNTGNQQGQVVGQQAQVRMYPTVMQEANPVLMNNNPQSAVLQTSNGELSRNSQPTLLQVQNTTDMFGYSSQDNAPSQTQGAETNSTLMKADNQNTFAGNAGLLESQNQPTNSLLSPNQPARQSMVPMPVGNQDVPNQQSLNTENLQSQSVVAPEESYRMPLVNENVPVENGQPTNFNQVPQDLQQTIDSGMIQHNHHAPVNQYVLPANGETNPWSMAPYYTYPMNPNAKADLINYMRQTAMQYYGQYPSYPQMSWNPQVLQQPGTSMPFEQNGNIVGAPSASDSSRTMVTPDPSEFTADIQAVHVTTAGYETQPPTFLPSTDFTTPTLVKETFISSTPAPLVNTVKIKTSNSFLNPNISKDESLSSLDSLTPHKNMTNEELHKIIKILLVPHKVKQLAATKAASKQGRINRSNPQRAAVSVRRIISPPPTPIKGDSRRPVSEMHIRMVNYAPPPSFGLHGTLQNQKPLSEIKVKLVNYDQKIIDTFKSHISSPFATRSKWVSTPGRRTQIPKIRQMNTTKTTNESDTTLASKLVAPKTPNTTSPTDIGTPPLAAPIPSTDKDRLRAQEDVKNHQKAVVRHTQMLHHVMGSLKNELNRFQGSVRRSRTLVPPEASSTFPKPSLEDMISKFRGSSSYNSSLLSPINQNVGDKNGNITISNQNKTAVNNPRITPIFQKPLTVDLKAKKVAQPVHTTFSPLIPLPSTPLPQDGSVTTPVPANIRSFQKNAKVPLTSSTVDGLKKTRSPITGFQEASYTIPVSKPTKVELSLFSVLGEARKEAMNRFPNKPIFVQTTDNPTTTVYTASSPLPKTTTTEATIDSGLPPGKTKEKDQSLSKQVLEDRLGEQLGKLDSLHHRQKLMKQQQILKEQHARLQKQRDLLQNQLKSLQALRDGPPMGVPETPSGLAVLLESLQKSLV